MAGGADEFRALRGRAVRARCARRPRHHRSRADGQGRVRRRGRARPVLGVRALRAEFRGHQGVGGARGGRGGAPRAVLAAALGARRGPGARAVLRGRVEVGGGRRGRGARRRRHTRTARGDAGALRRNSGSDGRAAAGRGPLPGVPRVPAGPRGRLGARAGAARAQRVRAGRPRRALRRARGAVRGAAPTRPDERRLPLGGRRRGVRRGGGRPPLLRGTRRVRVARSARRCNDDGGAVRRRLRRRVRV